MSSKRITMNRKTRSAGLKKPNVVVPTIAATDAGNKGPPTRRELKRNIISLQTMLRAKDITAEERMELSKQLLSVRNDLNNLLNKNNNGQQVHEIEISPEEKESRRQFLANNPGLRDTFKAIWMVFVPYTDGGILTKEGYLKFQQVIHVSLIGSSNNTILEDVSANIEKDLSHDNALFGPLNEEAFYDLMFEILETWSEIIDPYYYAAFAWTLLDSIANTTVHPPKIRPFREIKCITKIENEASMIKHYLGGKKVRAALALEADMLSRVPEVQKRLHARKKGADLDQGQQDMINALTVSMGFHRQDGQTPYEQNDSDSETSLCESMKLEEVPSEAPAVIQGEGGQADGKGDEMETVPDGDSCSTTSTQSGEFIAISRPIQRRSNYMMRTSTESFMNYVQSRRSSKMMMNGGYGFNHSKYVGDSFSISEGPDDQSEETHKQKLRNFSFAQFVSSGKSFDDFKREQQMDQETSSHSSSRMSLLKHMDRKSSSKFEISSQIAEGAGSDDSSVASNFSFYGNKNAKLSITATACTPANKRKSQYSRKSIRKEPIDVDASILNSSYLLKIESSTQDDASLASSTSSARLQQPISSSGNKQDFQKNLADTMKYGIGKRTDTVVLDAQLFAERLNKVKIGHITTSPHHDRDGNMSSDQSSASFVSKKSGLVFSDEDSFQTSNTNIAVKTFPHSSHIEPSQGKSFHDPLNSKLVEAFFAAHELKESALKEAFERNEGKSGNNSHSNSPVKHDEAIGIGTTSTVEQQPMRNRFLSLIEGGDSTTKPISTDLAMAYSNSAWDVHRAMQGVKMHNHKKMKLLETMQQVTVASLIENSTCSSDKSLVKVQSVKKNSVCSNSSQNSPINAAKATSVQPPIISESMNEQQISDQQPVLSTLTLTLDDEVSVDEKTEVDLFKERHQADNVNNRGDNSPLVGDEIKVPSVGALSYHRDSDPILVEPPRIAYSDSFDDSPIQQRGISRRSILSTPSRSTTARSDDESWAGSIPELLSHPAHASPPSSKSKAREGARRYSRTPKDSAVSLNMDSIQEEGKLYHQENRNQWGSRGLKSPNVSSRLHQNSLAGCQSLPELVIKPMVELPRVKTSKSKLAVTPKSPLNESLTVTGIDASKPSKDISSPPPRTNSPSAIRRLQRPTSPVVVEEVKSMLHIQGSLASSGPYLPQHGDFTESNSRFFLQVPSSSSWGDLNSMNRSTMTLTKAASHKKVPWLPRGTLTPLDHDRSDLIEGWREKIELLRYQPFDASKIPMTIKSQVAAKQAFEQYARSLSHPAKIK